MNKTTEPAALAGIESATCTLGITFNDLCKCRKSKLYSAATVEQLVQERNGWIDSAREFSNGMEYYRGQLDACARHIGLPCFTADDGGVHEEPLRAKVAEEVERLVQERDDYKKDAERYRWLRDTFHKAVGAGIEVNDDALVYQDCEPGEEVRLYWYPDTPIGFYESKASTIDAAIDAALAKHSPEDEIERARRMI